MKNIFLIMNNKKFNSMISNKLKESKQNSKI